MCECGVAVVDGVVVGGGVEVVAAAVAVAAAAAAAVVVVEEVVVVVTVEEAVAVAGVVVAAQRTRLWFFDTLDHASCTAPAWYQPGTRSSSRAAPIASTPPLISNTRTRPV